MVEKFEHTNLAECVRRHVGRPAATIELEPISTGKFNTGYFVTSDGDELVLRVAPPADSVFLFYERDMMRQEPGIHRLLLEETDVPVAEIIAYDDSHDVIDRDFILMRRLPGTPLSQAPVADAEPVMRRVGECLAQTHSLTADRYGYLGEHRPMEPADNWVDAFAVMWRKLLDDIVGVGHYSTAERDDLVGLLDRHIELFDRPGPARLLHMDVWAQNILVDDAGRLTGLVDWDRALWGDPEIEFAVLDYCGISTPAFWRGYGRPRDESQEARIRNVFYLLYELQKYIVIREGRGHDSRAARGYKQQAQKIIHRAFDK